MPDDDDDDNSYWTRASIKSWGTLWLHAQTSDSVWNRLDGPGKIGVLFSEFPTSPFRLCWDKGAISMSHTQHSCAHFSELALCFFAVSLSKQTSASMAVNCFSCLTQRADTYCDSYCDAIRIPSTSVNCMQYLQCHSRPDIHKGWLEDVKYAGDTICQSVKWTNCAALI